MYLHWLSQCFWNYLDWPEICHYVSTCVVMGPDYQVYMCVAVLKHLQQDILQHTQTQDLQVFLKVSLFVYLGLVNRSSADNSRVHAPSTDSDSSLNKRSCYGCIWRYSCDEL